MAEKSVSTESFAAEKKSEFTGKKFRVAVVGCGGISNTHMGALTTFPDVEVVAGVDIDADRLAKWGEKWKVAKLYGDWATMLKEIQPDGVSVCTPNGVHAQPAIDASNAGCHVLVEKPMALDPVQCQQMIDAAKKAGKTLVAGFQYRYHPYTEFLTRARDAGEFGNVMFVKARALRRRGIPNWGVFGRKELQGGGPMIDIGVHVLEMSHYTMGSPRPVAATGNTWTYLGNKASDVASMWPNWDHKTYTVEDLAVGHIRFENGAVLQIEAMFAGHIKEDVWTFDLVGDKGGATWDPPSIYTDRAGTMITSTPAFTGSSTDFPYLFKQKLRNWVDGATKGAALRAPGEAGLAVQKMLDGVYRSAAAGGREVTID